ncbi:hypothetical protein MTO96_044558, partial [Rhipicephalus appendiculatus]
MIAALELKQSRRSKSVPEHEWSEPRGRRLRRERLTTCICFV